MKILGICLLLVAASSLRGSPQPFLLEPAESRPKEIGGLEFSIVTQSVFLPDGRDSVVQLRITNRGTAPLLFPTFDSFSITLTGPDHKPVPLGGNRDATTITPNILLQPGKSFCWPLSVRLKSSAKPGSLELDFKDPTGSQSLSTLKPGSYTLQCELFPTHYDFAGKGGLPAPLWSAKGSTEPVSITLDAPEPAR
ncbi:MAG: hypothetical protein JWO82_690 [Akkermansiaceae bacterium]|nr:hypothetical protein [Akkermansiaceae bacterium]